MQLAKSVIDVGLSTNNLEPMLRFWQQDVAVRFDHVLPVRRGQKQYRHDEQGSVIKLNYHAEPLPEAAPSGYRELIIAREGLQKPRRMVDPDGNRVRLVPLGFDGVIQLAVAMGVRSLREHRRFYGDILGFAEQSWSGGPDLEINGRPRSGSSLLERLRRRGRRGALVSKGPSACRKLAIVFAGPRQSAPPSGNTTRHARPLWGMTTARLLVSRSKRYSSIPRDLRKEVILLM
jgi:hypothetical protein